MDKKNTVYVVLPLSDRVKSDVFLDILKNVVARSKLCEDDLQYGVKCGLKAKTVHIKSKDLAYKKEQSSKSQQIRLSRLLGFWAVNNFPSLGKKLVGVHWKPAEQRSVCVENQKMMMPEEVDATVFQTLKLRIIQLCVYESTLDKIKHFVFVPPNVCEGNSVRISKKMNLFNVQNEHIEKCWIALKEGKFAMSQVSFT